jgi:hypothetical protein
VSPLVVLLNSLITGRYIRNATWIKTSTLHLLKLKPNKQGNGNDRSPNVLPLVLCGICESNLATEALVAHRRLELWHLKETQHTEEVFHGIYQTAH